MAVTSVAAPEVKRFTCTQFLPLLPVAVLITFGFVGHPSGVDLDPRFCKSAHIISELSEFKLRYKNNYLDKKGNTRALEIQDALPLRSLEPAYHNHLL